MSTALVEEGRQGADARAAWTGAARTLATITLVGALAGAIATGLIGRLAMMLLAVLNPGATGLRSDDGFPIGEFSVSGSLQLALAGVQLGVTGAFFYLVFRGLMVGPAWFRLLSISLGPGLVVGALIVHTDGVDFTALDPAWLAAALFVAIPTAYVAMLHVVGERLLAAGWSPPLPLLGLGLLPWLVLLPLTAALAGGFAAVRWLRRTDGGRTLLASRWPAWVVRAGLAVLVVLAITDLVRDVHTLS